MHPTSTTPDRALAAIAVFNHAGRALAAIAVFDHAGRALRFWYRTVNGTASQIPIKMDRHNPNKSRK